MPDLSEMYYDGLRQQIARVMHLLGDERIEKGLTAFENGASTWSHCFFARALAPERLNGEEDVARILGLKNPNTRHGLNLVPVRIVYRTFDGASQWMTKDDLRQMIRTLQDEGKQLEAVDKGLSQAATWLADQAKNVNNTLKKINFMGAENTPLKLGGPTCA